MFTCNFSFKGDTLYRLIPSGVDLFIPPDSLMRDTYHGTPAPSQMLRGSRVAAGSRMTKMGRYRPSCLKRYMAIIYLRFIFQSFAPTRDNMGRRYLRIALPSFQADSRVVRRYSHFARKTGVQIQPCNKLWHRRSF